MSFKKYTLFKKKWVQFNLKSYRVKDQNKSFKFVIVKKLSF